MTVSLLATLAAGFALGLAGSLHCAGMCGPIAISLPGGMRRGISGDAWRRPRVAHRMLYQLGRVLTYTALGLVAGLGGSIFRLAGFSRELSISAGVLLLLMAMGQLLIRRGLKPAATRPTDANPTNTRTAVRDILQKFTALVQVWMRSLMARHGALTHLGIGLANGLLPCGLVTTAMVASLSAHSLAGSAAFMASFGLGTVPLMSAIAIFGVAIPYHWRSRFRRAAPMFAVILGVLILVRGLGLGVPYLSPPAPTVAQPMSCCTG